MCMSACSDIEGLAPAPLTNASKDVLAQDAEDMNTHIEHSGRAKPISEHKIGIFHLSFRFFARFRTYLM